MHKKRVFSDAKELEILSVGISNKNNSILVGAIDWTDEKQQTIINVAGIDNVLFETIPQENMAVEQEETNISEESEADLQLEKAGKYYVGDVIQNKSHSASSVLSACVIRDGVEGYITTGHNNNRGDDMRLYYDTQGRLGTVAEVRLAGSVDAAFIEKDPYSGYSLTDEVRLSSDKYRMGTIVSGDIAKFEGTIICFRAASGYRTATVTDTNFSVSMGDGTVGNERDYYNMIRMDMIGLPGDSGSPILTTAGDVLDKKYNIVGIWKGTYGSSGVATHWYNIENRLNVELY